MPQSPRVRLAPSPTGFIHVGTLRTALYNYLFARQHAGTYLLRVEDTDQSRFVEGSIENLIHNLAALGLNADEGVREQNKNIEEAGEYGPYQQSKRLPLYQKEAEKLIQKGSAYYCFCSADRLTALREEQQKNKQAPKYDKHCLRLSEEEVAKKRTEGPFVIRFNIPAGQVVEFTDLVRGKVSVKSDDLDDQILIKSDGFPTGVFAIVVDDIAMHITHVIKGEEWLPTTPKQILMYQALEQVVPVFAHLPLLLNPDKTKLSKRQGDVAVEDYLRKGYLKPALLNFVALLGWNPGKGSTQEIFSLEELVHHFDITHIHKGGAVFDHKKLDWMNSEYIKKMQLTDLYQELVEGEFFDKELIKNAPAYCQQKEYLQKVLIVEQERLATLAGFGEENPFFFMNELQYDTALLAWKENTQDETRENLKKALTLMDTIPEEEWESREQLQSLLLEAAGDKRGDFLWPLRVALCGAQKSPSPADLLFVLGKEIALKRLQLAIDRL